MKRGAAPKFKDLGSTPAKEKVNLTKKQVGPVAEKIKTDWDKMSDYEKERYMNDKHISIVPRMSDFIYSAIHNKKKKND